MIPNRYNNITSKEVVQRFLAKKLLASNKSQKHFRICYWLPLDACSPVCKSVVVPFVPEVGSAIGWPTPDPASEAWGTSCASPRSTSDDLIKTQVSLHFQSKTATSKHLRKTLDASMWWVSTEKHIKVCSNTWPLKPAHHFVHCLYIKWNMMFSAELCNATCYTNIASGYRERWVTWVQWTGLQVG